jgi:environmental stress-induced protein Ves
MPVTRFEIPNLPLALWKNGAGLTREIVRSPRDSTMDTFAWRVSIAEVSESGAFSVFPGVDRIIVLLSGDGAVLRSADGAIDHRLDRELAPFSVPGESAIDARLVGGRSTDFNVMTRRDAIHAEVQVIRSRHVVARTSSGVLLSMRGNWTAVIGAETESISANCGAWWDDEETECQLAPASNDAALIAVRVWRARKGA